MPGKLCNFSVIPFPRLSRGAKTAQLAGLCGGMGGRHARGRHSATVNDCF